MRMDNEEESDDGGWEDEESDLDDDEMDTFLKQSTKKKTKVCFVLLKE